MQKADMYSLGVIFFEMCHPPLSTDMERHVILTSLRQDQPELPKVFSEVKMQKKVCPLRPLTHAVASDREGVGWGVGHCMIDLSVAIPTSHTSVQLLIVQCFHVLHNPV